MVTNGLLYIHKAILREARSLETAVVERAEPEALLARLRFFEELLHHHTDGEEQFLFPEIERRAPRVCATYVFDHKDERALLGRLAETIERTDLEAARRAVIALVEHLDAHIRKENELIVPLIDELFTPAEHEAMVGRIQGAIPPPFMARVLPWLALSLDSADRVAFLSVLPPERRAPMLGLLQAALPPAIWSELERSLPTS
jgi:hemerythrin-like domain-containing protein